MHRCTARYRVLAMGRRYGKTLLCVAEAIRHGLDGKGRDYYWVAPTADLTQIGWDLWDRIVDPRLYTESKTQRYKQLRNRSRWYFRSADNPRSLVGRGLAGAIIDECGDVAREAWDVSLRPALSEHQGWAIMIGTPRGRNWFHELWVRGRDEQEPEWASFQCPTSDNPHIPPIEIDAARRSLPDAIFRQEYLAEFLDDGAGAFRGVDGCILPVGAWEPPASGSYVLGVDLAKHTDWTVCIAMHAATRRAVEVERYNQIDWPLQKARILAMAKRWRAPIILDATGIGDPIYDDLRHAGAVVRPVVLTPKTKTRIIQQLIVAIEQRAIAYPPWPVLLDELRSYAYHYTASGVLSYSAPEGYHDDCVISLALALDGSTFPQQLVYLA